MSDGNSLADVYNLTAAQGMYGPNPYLKYTGQIPMAGYYGTPTDARGNPIQSFVDAQAQHDAWDKANPAPPPGKTLNSPPDMMAMRNAALTGQPGAALAYGANFAPAGSPPGIQQMYGQNFAAFTPQQNWTGNTQPAAAAPAAASNPVDMRQAYLDALSNPGKVTTPGAVMQPGTTPTGPASQPSVLDAFLAAHPSGGTASQSYTNQPFFNTLAQLKKGATA